MKKNKSKSSGVNYYWIIGLFMFFKFLSILMQTRMIGSKKDPEFLSEQKKDAKNFRRKPRSTGTFLPPIANGQPTGSKTDLSIVEQCSRWAKKGYVAVAMENRLGWNPTSSDQDVRTSTLLQAAYRGIQDAKAMVRYMRMTEDNGNPHGINPDKIILGGQGTGGYLSLGYATLNDPGVELMLPKFINFNTATPTPYVFPPFFGNPDGTDSTYLPDFASPTGQTELWKI